jgi:hypothetical protein
MWLESVCVSLEFPTRHLGVGRIGMSLILRPGRHKTSPVITQIAKTRTAKGETLIPRGRLVGRDIGTSRVTGNPELTTGASSISVLPIKQIWLPATSLKMRPDEAYWPPPIRPRPIPMR